MAPKFGTSGLRGLVTELTPDLVGDHVRAFLAACPQGDAVHVGWDLRPSSPEIAEVVCAALTGMGMPAVRAGVVPTPALALGAMGAGCGAIMITGSHIPADRNGLKFYLPDGEISKADEAAILGALGQPAGTGTAAITDDAASAARYTARYTSAFGPQALAGLRVGIYQHSSVARDIMAEVVEACGGTAIPLAWSDTFIPVDTEAVDPETREMCAAWCAEHALDALISTDGDADRPMVTDASGRIVPGDVLGPLTARALGAEVICTPVSSNSMVQQMGFGALHRTRIGSPFVIAAMEDVLAADKTARVVGYEANGGFLLGFEASGPAGPLPPLMTRDCLLPIIAPLAAARAKGHSLAELAAELPAVFTAADRLQGIETDRSKAFIARLTEDRAARAAFFDTQPEETGIDTTDGLRVSFADGTTVHLRPSGNAPECRCYTEAGSRTAADALLATHLAALQKALG